MKRYYFEADKKQWEKPTEPKYVFCATAKTDVYADDEQEARILAESKLRDAYHGTGVLLGEIRLVDVKPLPADWSYGYDEERQTGDTDSIPDRLVGHVIR